MNVNDTLDSLKAFVNPEFLRKKLATVTGLLKEEVVSVIPSYQLAADGTNLASILATTNSYLTEIRTPSSDDLDFDVVSVKSIRNYRIRTWNHQVLGADPVKTLQIANITLHHDVMGFSTEIQYAGTDRDAWIAYVLENIPVEAVKIRHPSQTN